MPYSELLPHVSVLVTNGGYGGLQQALAHGVPIVVAGATEDKPETAARVAWSGVGLRLREQCPDPGHVRDAVLRVLREPRYRARAQAIADEMAPTTRRCSPPTCSSNWRSSTSPSRSSQRRHDGATLA